MDGFLMISSGVIDLALIILFLIITLSMIQRAGLEPHTNWNLSSKKNIKQNHQIQRVHTIRFQTNDLAPGEIQW